MFGLFGNKKSTLEKKHKKILQEAMELQRKGDIKAYAVKTEEAKAIEEELKNL